MSMLAIPFPLSSKEILMGFIFRHFSLLMPAVKLEGPGRPEFVVGLKAEIGRRLFALLYAEIWIIRGASVICVAKDGKEAI